MPSNSCAKSPGMIPQLLKGRGNAASLSIPSSSWRHSAIRVRDAGSLIASTAVRTYRLYFLDEDNDVIRATELTHPDDTAAVADAASLLDPDAHHTQLWCSSTLVASWPAA